MKYSFEEMNEASEASQSVFDTVLIRAGEERLARNTRWMRLPDFTGRWPMYRVQDPEAVPWVVMFAGDFEVELLGYGELIVFSTVDVLRRGGSLEPLDACIDRLLRSQVVIDHSGRLLMFDDASADPWVKRSGSVSPRPDEGSYAPYLRAVLD